MAAGQFVPSPCIDICVIDRRMKICIGCGRTAEEIAAWPAASDALKREILAVLPGRLAELAGAARGG